MLELDFIVYNDRTNNKLWHNYVNYIISITNYSKDKSNNIIHNSHYVGILNGGIYFTDFKTSGMTLINLHDVESGIDLFDDDYYINIKECSHDYANNIKCIFKDLYKKRTYSYDCDYYGYNKKLKQHEVYNKKQINNIKEIGYNTLLSSYIIHSVSNHKVLTLENNTELLVDFIIEDDGSDGVLYHKLFRYLEKTFNTNIDKRYKYLGILDGKLFASNIKDQSYKSYDLREFKTNTINLFNDYYIDLNFFAENRNNIITIFKDIYNIYYMLHQDYYGYNFDDQSFQYYEDTEINNIFQTNYNQLLLSYIKHKIDEDSPNTLTPVSKEINVGSYVKYKLGKQIYKVLDIDKDNVEIRMVNSSSKYNTNINKLEVATLTETKSSTVIGKKIVYNNNFYYIKTEYEQGLFGVTSEKNGTFNIIEIDNIYMCEGIDVSMKDLQGDSGSNEEQTNLIPNKINMKNEINNLLITEFISDKNNIKAIKEIKEFIETNVGVLREISNVLDRYGMKLQRFNSDFDGSIEDSDIDTIKELIEKFESIKEFINNFKLLRIEQVVKQEPKESFDVQKYFNN